MASMEDLVATMRGGMHVGQGNDLKELQTKLAQTLHPTKAPYRPIPPSTLSPGNGTIPPAPASSWNDAFTSPQSTSQSNANGSGTSPSKGGKKDVGFSIPPPKSQPQSQAPSANGNAGRDVRNQELDDGFRDDAFRPLWQSGSGQTGK